MKSNFSFENCIETRSKPLPSEMIRCLLHISAKKPRQTLFFHQNIQLYVLVGNRRKFCNKCVNNILTLVKSSANRFLVPENGVCVGIRRFYMKKLGEISIFLRWGVKKHVFCYFRGFFGVKKFFGRRIRVFQPFLTPEMMFLGKKFFSKKCPKNWQNSRFFWGTL